MKKTLSLILVLTLVFVFTVPALAANEESGSTTLTYTVDSTYGVVIPEDVTLTTAAEGIDRIISVNTVRLSADETLTCTMTSANFDTDGSDGFRVKYNEDSYIKYTVKKGGTEVTTNGSTILTVRSGDNAGSTTLNFSTTQENIDGATRAGAHTDTLTFAFAIVGTT